jgi:hypothetical protein
MYILLGYRPPESDGKIIAPNYLFRLFDLYLKSKAERGALTRGDIREVLSVLSAAFFGYRCTSYIIHDATDVGASCRSFS